MKKRGRKPGTKPNLVARAVRINEVMAALVDGKTSRADLAAKFGVTERQISYDVEEAMTKLTKSMLTSADSYRALQWMRHEKYLETINDQIDNAIAVNAPASVVSLLMNTGAKILDQENKLMTLYTTKLEVAQTTTHEFVLPASQAAEMLALMDAQGFLTAPAVEEGEYREVSAEEGAMLSDNEREPNGKAV